MFSVSRRYTFEAAHRLTKVPATHRCRRLHGHSWSVEIAVAPHALNLAMIKREQFSRATGKKITKAQEAKLLRERHDLDNHEMVIDFATIDAAWKPTYDLLDHNYLNDVKEIGDPTSERVAEFICNRVQAELDKIQAKTHDEKTGHVGTRRMKVVQVNVSETTRSIAVYRVP